MINDNEKSINEEESVNPTVQAVMAALNGSAGSDAGRIQRMIAAKQEAAKALANKKEEEEARAALAGKVSDETAEKLIQKGKDDAANRAARAMMNESFEETGEIVIDIVEENGKIVELDNGILFIEEDIPFIDVVEKYYGADYIDDVINEAVTQQKKTAPVKAKAKAPAPVNMMASQKPKGVVAAAAKPKAPAKPTGAAKTGNTKVNPKTKKTVKPTPAQIRVGAPTAPSSTEANIQKRAKERNLDFSASDQKLADQLKATDQVVGDKTKSDFASMKPGKVKQSFLSKITGGRLGKTTFTPGDSGTLGDFGKDFTKKISDTAADIAKERDKKRSDVEPPVGEPGAGGYSGAGNAGDIGDGGADEAPAKTTGGGASSGGGQPSGGRGLIPIRFRLDGQEMKQSDYKKARQSGEVESQDVTFNVKNKKTGLVRPIRKGDAEYDAYYSGYKKMGRAVTEALLRMGAVLTEEGWMLGDELLESVYTEYAPVEMRSPYYYDNTGRLRIMTESEWTELGLAEVILERVISEAMDDVGSEDEDVDNDGDSDSSDDYLKNRREKIAAAIKGKK
jgi:hypothetical protein